MNSGLESRLIACDRDTNNACRLGYLDVVEWRHAHSSWSFTVDAMDLAAANGHLHIVQWLHVYRTEGCTTRAIDMAAAFGHLPVVQWLRVNI